MTNLFITASTIALVLLSCEKDDEVKEEQNPTDTSSDYIIFGHYYGMCVGEECVELFQVKDQQLFEDQIDSYPAGSFYYGDYVQLSDEKYQLARRAIKSFPNDLLLMKDTVFGCPDCADQGGLYIEYSSNITRRYWNIDQSKKNVPAFLHDFMDEVNASIALINE